MSGFAGGLAECPRWGTSPSPTIFSIDYRMSILGR